MAVIASDRADFWGFNAQNYLLSYCNGNGLNPANYYVENRQDESTGLIYLYLHPVADGGAGSPATDPATATPILLASADPEVATETTVAQ